MVGFSSALPHWLESLLGEKFFNPCLVHEDVKKNETNIFCLDCCTSICPHCLSSHPPYHRLLQIRRYVYHDVIRLEDMEKLFDCSFVQGYITNSAKVIFLNQRPQSRPFRGSGNICSTCGRSLQESYLFCSLACKVDHLLRMEGGVSKYLYECEFLPFTEQGTTRGESSYYCDFDDGQMTPDSVLESPVSYRTSSGSSASTGNGIGGGSGMAGCRSTTTTTTTTTLACTATTDFVRKKRSNVSGSRNPSYRPTCCSPASEIAISMNRRKGIPQRSPLY